MRVFKNAWFCRFARKQELSEQQLYDAVRRAERGQIDADLGGGVIKQRLARDGQGRSAGYRTIILYRAGERAFLVFGFAKNAQANISRHELAQFRQAATALLALNDKQLAQLLAAGQLEEVVDDQELPQ